MQPVQTGHARSLRLALVAVALFVLLAIVAFASRSGFGHASTTRPTPTYLNWAMSVFMVVFVLMIPVAVWAYSLQAREALAAREREHFGVRVAKRLLVVIAIAFLAFLARIYVGNKYFPHFHAPFVRQPPQVHGKALHDAGSQHYQPTFQWPVLWITLALAVVIVGYIVYRRSKLEPLAEVERTPRSDADEVASAISDAIDDLRAEPDPRRAVIAAYARMEASFARQGLKRKTSETAIEYLRRILLGLGSHADPVARLTGLFEQAKFSLHEIDGAMKDDAIQALVAIRSDLRKVSA